MAKTYIQKLRDPKWQRKRLEIMNRDDFTCQECSAKDKTLNVHHLIYRKGCDPWEYEPHELKTLCEDCHSKVTVEDSGIKEWLANDDNRLFVSRLIALERVDIGILDCMLYRFKELVTNGLHWCYLDDQLSFKDSSELVLLNREVDEKVDALCERLTFIKGHIGRKLESMAPESFEEMKQRNIEWFKAIRETLENSAKK